MNDAGRVFIAMTAMTGSPTAWWFGVGACSEDTLNALFRG